MQAIPIDRDMKNGLVNKENFTTSILKYLSDWSEILAILTDFLNRLSSDRTAELQHGEVLIQYLL